MSDNTFAVLVLAVSYAIIYLSLDALWRIVVWKHRRDMRKRSNR
jgi:hypothetical protein